MSTLTLGYWSIRGLAESIRMLLNYLSVPYEEVLYDKGPPPDFSEKCWFSVKYTLGLDYPNIPYLYDGDLKLTESVAILRYLCGKYKPELLGTNLKEKMYVDMTMGVLGDLFNAKTKLAYYGKDCEGHEMCEITMKNKLNDINKFLEKNKFLSGEKLSFVDFVCAEFCESINDLLQPIFNEYKNIKRHFDDICAIPSIKKYRSERKPRPYYGGSAKYGGVV